MRYLRFALLPLVFAACTERAPVAPIEDGPAFNWMNNTDVANPRIFRGETDYLACWSDATNGLRACHATVPLGGGTEPDCGLQEVGDPIGFQDIGTYNPDDPFSSWIHETVTGPVFITVRDQTQPGECFGNLLVAQGWGNFRYVDNDIFGVGEGDRNANSWGFSGHGALTTPDGGTVQYDGSIHYVYNQTIFKLTSAKVAVH